MHWIVYKPLHFCRIDKESCRQIDHFEFGTLSEYSSIVSGPKFVFNWTYSFLTSSLYRKMVDGHSIGAAVVELCAKSFDAISSYTQQVQCIQRNMEHSNNIKLWLTWPFYPDFNPIEYQNQFQYPLDALRS